jgi:AraC-like DNA-binding protein
VTSIDLINGGYTLCGPSWGSHGWISETVHKLYLVERGGGAYAIPGHEVVLAPGRLYLIPGGRPHRYGAARGMQVAWLHLRVLSPAVERRLAGLSTIAGLPAADWDWWRPAWAAMPGWMRARDQAGELRLQALVAAVLAEVLAGTVGGPALDPRLEGALRWMELHCLKHPATAAAARVAGLAPAVFHRRFVAAVGATPRDWLELRRLDHARRLLREPDTSVQAVAAACGYANAFHFSRVVRRCLGCCPSRLRQADGP